MRTKASETQIIRLWRKTKYLLKTIIQTIIKFIKFFFELTVKETEKRKNAIAT